MNPLFVQALVPVKLDRGLLARVPHVWALRVPAVVVLSCLLVVPILLTMICLSTLVTVDLRVTILLGLAFYATLLFSWSRILPRHVFPYGGQITRSAADDLAVAAVTFAGALILGASVGGSIVAGFRLAVVEADARDVDVVRTLLSGVEYLPEKDAKELRDAVHLHASGLVDVFGRDRDVRRDHALRVIRDRDIATLRSDMNKYVQAVGEIMPAGGPLPNAEDALRCLAGVHWGGTPADCWRIDHSADAFPMYGEEFLRKLSARNATSASMLATAGSLVGLLAFWYAITLSWTSDILGAGLALPLIGAGLPVLFAGEDSLLGLKAEVAMTALIVVIWALYVSGCLMIAGSKRSIRLNGFHLVIAMTMIAVIALVLDALFPGSLELARLRPHALWILATYAVLVPLLDYVAKRTAVAPLDR